MAELEGLSVSLTADTGGLDRGMRSAEQSVARAERALTASAGRMDQAMAQVNRSASLVTQRLTQFAAVIGVGGLAAMAAKTLTYAEAWTQVGNRLRLVSQDAGQMKATQEQLFQAAQKAGVSMASVVDVYSRASQAAGELGASQEQLTRFSGGVAQALAVSATSADAASGATQQLGQLLGSTRVQAEEFNSILDGAPRVAKAVADGLTEAGGSVSRLKQLINDGKVTNKQFFDAFLAQIPKIQAEFDKTVPTIARSLATLDNAMGKLIGEANEAGGATTTLARGIQALGENLNAVATGVTAVGTAMASVYVARGLVPAIAAGLEFAKAQIALRGELVRNTGHIFQKEAALRAGAAAAAQAAAADLAAAEAAAVKARSDLAARAAQYEAAVALDAAIGKTARLVQAEEALAAARLARAAADERVAQTSIAVNMASQAQASAIARTTAAATLLSRAGAGLSSLLGLVGGPWGAAFLAAGAAVAYLATRTSEADKAQELYNRTLTEGRRRIDELTGASRERANQLREEQRNELSAAQAAADAAAQKVAALQALIAEQRASADPSEAGGTAGMFSNLFGNGDAGLKRLEAQLAAARKQVEATAAVLDGMMSVSQKTGDAVGLELASKLSRGTAAFNALNTATGDALKQAGLTVQSGRLMTNEQAETEKAVTALGQALKAGSGLLRTYGTDAQQIAGIMAALKLKIDPVASAIADMNRELAQAGAAEGAARTALTVLQGINQQREKEGKAPLTTVSPEYLQLLGKAQEVETKRVEAATAARAKVLDLDKQIARAQAAGNAAQVADLNRQKAVEQMVARGTDRKVAEANAAQDYAVAIAEAGAAAGQAGKDILLAADAQMVMAQAAGLGEAATRQAAYATKLAQEAAKGNGNVMAVAAANRREEAAAIVQIRNETVRTLELETANTNALTLAMASGGAAVRVAQEEEYKLALIRKLGADATVAGTEAQKALNDAMDAYRKNRAANDNNRLQQERQSANDNLALAQRELELMGQAEPVRERAMTALRNQQEAARKVAELGEDGARQWLAWQEQIADKRAMIDYLKAVQATAKEISGDISEALYDRLMDPGKATSVVDVFKSIFKRIAIAALEANIVLPIVTQVVGAMPSLFGITAPSGATGAAGTATNSLTGSLTNTAVSKAGGWAMDKLGLTGGITNAIDKFGYSTLGIGTMAGTQGTMMTTTAGGLAADIGVMPTLGGVSNAAATGSTTVGGITGGLSAYLSAAGAGALGGGLVGGWLGTKTNSKVVGGAAGALAGAGAGYLSTVIGLSSLGGPVGAAIGAVVGLIMGMIGTQKASVGPTASADITINAGGKSATAGNFQVDNDGKIEDAQKLGTAFSTIFTAAAAGGGTLKQDFGIGQTAAKGLYVGGSVPYKEFGTGDDALGNLLRYTLLEAGGLTNAGAAVTKAIRNTKATSYEDAAKDIALGAGIDAGTTALAALDKSLASFTKAAKEATAESLKPMLDELERAKGLDLGSEYVRLATDQLNAYLDQLRNPPDYTQAEQDMAALTGQFQALREAYQQLNPALAATVDQIEAETRARIKASVQDDANRQLNTALGRDYLNSINDLMKTRDINARNLTAVGLSTQRATEIFDASLKSLLTGLDASQLDIVAASFSDDIHDLAVSLRDAASATTEAAQALASYQADINSRMYATLGRDRDSALLALQQQQAKELADAKAAGYSTDLLRQVQAAEYAAQAFSLAQADVLAAYDAQITAQQALVESLEAGAQAAQQFRQAYDALAVNDNSPLNARDRLAEARRQFEAAYQTAKSPAASEAEKTAALATLQQLGPALVQLAKGFFGSTDTSDYDRVRQVFAEFGGLQAQGVDTAQQQLDTANAALKELQRQRAEAASLGQKQYGALVDLNSIMSQSYAVWQAALTPLQQLTGTKSSATLSEMLAGLSTGTLPGIMTWARAQGPDTAYQVLRAADERLDWGNNPFRYTASADVAALGDKVPTEDWLSILRSVGYTGEANPWTVNSWLAAYGKADAYEAAMRSWARERGIPGYAVGTPSALPGLAWVGERGPELVRMAGGERVYPHETSLAMARRFQAANDRWGANVTALRAPSIPPIVINTAGLEQRLDRAVAVLERILGAIEDGDDETVSAISNLAKRLVRTAAPVGQRRAVNG
ncbi:tape measure protein [Azospirillum sp.]|uniref:tape measure protein n=1 Tax=Azospirillum sp. TaxID=34012 RepID=UPI002D64A74E|nr:tape measure protein [Azospirillum sp.]HYF87429.1 tape measure protein [Azospirillum sp.]